MSARAMWKGVLQLGENPVPVKLYSALENQKVSFRLLSRKDNAPVKQVLVNPISNDLVEYGAAGRGYRTGDRIVSLTDQELQGLNPEASREIKLLQFLPQDAIDYRWFDRPYYLGPDEDTAAWSALAAALASTELIGLAHWVMRNNEYYGALRLHQGMPMLLTMHSTDEVLPLDTADLRDDQTIEPRQLAMASKLIAMLEADFDPDSLSDEYRESVLSLISSKKQGKTVKPKKARAAVRTTDLSEALQKSLERSGANA